MIELEPNILDLQNMIEKAYQDLGKKKTSLIHRQNLQRAKKNKIAKRRRNK